jgi:dinuclear metal center YbgI/SA1388 family protein
MSVHGQTIIQWFENFSPKHLAVEGDKVGLQIGTLQKHITKIMITLDVTEAVVDEAIERKVDLIVAHHPVIYRPLSHVRTDLPGGRIISNLMKHDIAVYIAHTNLDVAKGGVNDWLAHQLELEDVKILSQTTLDQKAEPLGLGRIGKLKQEMTLKQFADHVKKGFDVPFCRIVGPLEAKVKKVAVLGGTGNKYMNAALFKGADVFVTGDIEYHTAHDAQMNGLHLVDPGHHIEKVMIKGVQEVLQKATQEHKAEVEVITSQIHTEPFRFV